MASPENSSLGMLMKSGRAVQEPPWVHHCIHTPQQDGEIHINFAITWTNLKQNVETYDLLDDI